MANILITDDAMFMRMLLGGTLKKLGHTIVAEASNGLEAVEMYKRHKPDLVTMDITMPEIDGIEALKRIMEVDPNAKVIMVSAMGQQVMVLDAIKAGAKDFLVKPFDETRVSEAINKILNR